MHVAIVGAGVSGASCTWQLMQAERLPLSLTLFEMGRGPGGRTASRRSREAPGLGFNHGAPLFHMRVDTEAAPLIDALRAAGHIVEWHGTGGTFDTTTGTSWPGTASRGEPEAEHHQLTRYVGNPRMSSLTDGILKLAGIKSPDIRYRTKVSLIRPSRGEAPGWELFDQEGNDLGVFDWVVITSASIFRWKTGIIFGEIPPMQLAARLSKSAQLTEVVKSLEDIRSKPVHVAMLAWAVPDEDSREPVVESLMALPFDVTGVVGDAVLARIVRQSLGPPYAVVVLHSTLAFAERHAQIHGSGSTIAQMSHVEGSAQSEAEVATALHGAFENLLWDLGAKALCAPTLGPNLQRWLSAFPECKHWPGAPIAQVIPQVQMAFAGDFLAPPDASVETALLSGLAAAQGILNADEQTRLHGTVSS